MRGDIAPPITHIHLSIHQRKPLGPGPGFHPMLGQLCTYRHQMLLDE